MLNLMEKNLAETVGITNNDENHEIVNFREYITLQKRKISFEDLFFALNEIQEEINSRTSLIREMIPGDVWMYIFGLATSKEDISSLLMLKFVCHQWLRVFSYCPITDAAIIIPHSTTNFLLSLPNLQSLTIKTQCTIPSDYFENHFTNLVTLKILAKDVKITSEKNLQIDNTWNCMTNLKNLELSSLSQIPENGELTRSLPLYPIMALSSFASLTSLRKFVLNLLDDQIFEFVDILQTFIHLKKLVIKQLSRHSMGSVLSDKLNSFLLNHLQQFERVSLPFDESRLNSFQIQQNNPHIRFRWYKDERMRHGSNYHIFGIYEGEFSNTDKSQYRYYSRFEGKGVYLFHDGSWYDGEWMNGKYEGRGILFENANKYEGEFKSNRKEGRGILYYADGSRYEGEFRNDLVEGKGTFFYSDEERYEGEWKNDLKEGRGTYYFFDGNKYVGEFKGDIMEGKGSLFYSNGDRYEGDFKKDKRDGNGIYFYINGNRLEGEWKNNMKEGKGVYFYSDGRKVECEFERDQIVKK